MKLGGHETGCSRARSGQEGKVWLGLVRLDLLRMGVVTLDGRRDQVRVVLSRC